MSEDDAKAFVQRALHATGMTLDQLSERLDYKSLKRAMSGEIPLPDSKRKHIQDLITIAEMHRRPAEMEPLTPRAKLKRAREAAGLTIAQLAKKIGYQIGVLQAIEDSSARMNERLAHKLVEVLPTLTLEDLLDGSETPPIIDESGMTGTVGAAPRIILPAGMRARYVPLLSLAQCGAMNGVDYLDEGYQFEGVLSTQTRDPRAFAVKARGESMTPKISEGDVIIVAPGERINLGDTVLVRTVHGDVLCKHYATKEGGKLVVLSSVNPSFSPIELRREEIAWIYPVREVSRRL